MNLNRREFIRLMGLAGAAGLLPGSGLRAGEDGSALYDMPAFGNARILHFTDCHAQLNPIYFREPSVNIGMGAPMAKPRTWWESIYWSVFQFRVVESRSTPTPT